MAKEIEVPNFLNYTDCRKNTGDTEKKGEKKLSEIERESIVNYAKGLNNDEMALFLSQVSTEKLLAVLSSRVLDTECKLMDLHKRVLETLQGVADYGR